MKKAFAMMLVFAMIFLVTACSSRLATKRAASSKTGNGYIAGTQIGMLPAPETENLADMETLLMPWERSVEYGTAEGFPACTEYFLGNRPEWMLAEGNRPIPEGQRILPVFYLPDKTEGKQSRFMALWTVAQDRGKKGNNTYGSRPKLFFRTGRTGIYQIRAFCRSRGP